MPKLRTPEQHHRSIASGGGFNSKVVRHSQGYKTEPKTQKANPAGVSQMGVAVKFHKEPIFQGKGYEPARVGSTGVPGRRGPEGAGPGGFGRMIYKTGSQSHYGPNAPTAVNTAPDIPATRPGRDIIGGFGPEKGKR
jgi:hypothetical protein